MSKVVFFHKIRFAIPQHVLHALYRLEQNLNKRTNGPVNAHLISWPTKAQNIQILENIW